MHTAQITTKIISELEIMDTTGQLHKIDAQWDTGASETCISNKLIKQLNLPKSTNSQSRKVTLGNGQSVLCIPYDILIVLPGINKAFQITAYEVPGIPVLLNLGLSFMTGGTVNINNNTFTFSHP